MSLSPCRGTTGSKLDSSLPTWLRGSAVSQFPICANGPKGLPQPPAHFAASDPVSPAPHRKLPSPGDLSVSLCPSFPPRRRVLNRVICIIVHINPPPHEYSPLITPSCFLIKFQCVAVGGWDTAPGASRNPSSIRYSLGVPIPPNFWLSTRAYGDAQEGRVPVSTLVAEPRSTQGTLEVHTQKDSHGLPV